MRDFRRMLDRLVWDGMFHGRFEDKPYAIGVFNRHNDQVRRVTPPERLLVYEINEGWGPLCSFLEVPIPEGKLFPHLNDAEEFRSRILRTAADDAVGRVGGGRARGPGRRRRGADRLSGGRQAGPGPMRLRRNRTRSRLSPQVCGHSIPAVVVIAAQSRGPLTPKRGEEPSHTQAPKRPIHRHAFLNSLAAFNLRVTMIFSGSCRVAILALLGAGNVAISRDDGIP